MDQIHQVEVVIHVDDDLNTEQRMRLVENLQRHDGVEQARFTDGRRHLMLIDYDAGKLNTTEVLGYVRQENVGAELIGI
jgi:cell division protein FtsX